MDRSPGKTTGLSRYVRNAVSDLRPKQSGRVVAINSMTRVASFIVAALIAVFGLLMVSGSAVADDDKYDFYTLSSNTTAYFSDATEPGKGEGLSEEKGWAQIGTNPAEGGGLLGYGDNDVSGFSGWLVSKATGSSNTVGYDSLKVRSSDDKSRSTNAAYSGVLAYGQYGSLLRDLGLDSMSTGLGLHITNLLGGTVMGILYLLAGGIDLTFAAIFGLLDLFNPFKLFFSAIAATSTAMANGMTGGQGVPGWMKDLEAWFGGWYQALVNLSWTVLVPLFIATFVFSSLMWKKGNALGGLKKLVVRLLFLGVGLPLVGSMYTSSLAAMHDATSGAGMGATRVIISTYVDFENWAKENRLAVPEGAVLEWDPYKHAATGTSSGKIRQTTVAINKLANSGAFSSVADMNVSELGSISSEATKSDSGGKSGGLSGKTFWATMDMLTRYITSQSYQASDFDTAIKGRISQQAANGNDWAKTCATTWFNMQSDGNAKNVAGCADGSVTAANNPVLNVREGSGLQASTENGKVTFTTKDDKWAGDWVVLGQGQDLNGANMSALAMYNYLNTTFSPNSATTYSSSNAVSSATREYHDSVNLVGSPGVSFLYFTNAAVTLLCFIVLGLAYAFGLFIGTVKNSLRIIASVPFATLGAIAGIAKVVIYSFAMIVEIIGTLFIYRVVQEIIVSVPSMFENGVERGYDWLGGFGQFLKDSGNVTPFISILSTVLLILLTIMLVRFRGVFVKGLTEAVTKIVDKFLDTSVAPPNGGALMPALAGGVGAGVGSAAANRMMGGRGKSGNGSKKGSTSSGLTTGSGGVQGPDGGASGVNEMPSINGTDGPGGSGPDDSGVDGGGNDPNTPVDGGSGGVHASIEAGSSGGDGTGGSSDTSASDREVAGEVEARGGLSEPSQIEAGPSAGDSGDAGADAAVSSSAVNASDDAMSDASGSMEHSMAEHHEADKARIGQATAGAQSAWHGSKAAAKAYAGDAAGAAKDGQKALGDVQKAKSKGQQAKAHRQAANAPAPAQPSKSSSGQQGRPARRGSVGSRPAQQKTQASSGSHPAPSRQGTSGAPSRQRQTQTPTQAPAPSRPAPAPAGSGSSGSSTPPSMPSAPVSTP